MALRGWNICFKSCGTKGFTGILAALVVINVTSIIFLIAHDRKTHFKPRNYSELGQRIAKARWERYHHLTSQLPKDVMDTLQRRLKQATDEKVIIMWYPPFGNKQNFTLNPAYCGNCVISYDKSLIKDSKTAAVVFHFSEISPDTMPTHRNPEQLHIFWILETPATLKHYRENTLKYEDEYGFNATASYRRDADFLSSYRRSTDAVKEFYEVSLKSNIKNLIKIKTRNAATMVSNCYYTEGATKRMSLLREIKGFGFDLETYGQCFGQPFPKGPNLVDRLRPYKFYFAFENSYHCRDYITEKFFGNGLLSGALPVVWGARKEEYELMAPPNSFIHVEDFNSIEEMVGYLNYLNKNDTAYLEYFRWYELLGKKSVQRTEFMCHICRAVHGINFDDTFHPNYDPVRPMRPLFADKLSPRKVSIEKWFYQSEDPECLSNSV